MATIDAHIAGTVWSIDIEVGDQVDVGDEVVILESMKMELPVESEVSGKVAKILCAKDDSVEEGQPLVELE